jgi:16S rRNA (cytosine1402-N4)-methyltransferase
MYTTNQHKSVLLKEVLHYLNLKPSGYYVDATFGGGGHSQAILEQNKNISVVGIDWDKKALEMAEQNFQDKYDNRLTLLWGNFAHLEKLLKKAKITHIDGILADFGTSKNQIFEKEGFSFSIDSPLDMRMSTAHFYKTAATVINRYSEKQLAEIFYLYGEEQQARKLVREIAAARKHKPFLTTKQLADFIVSIKGGAWKRIHPATKVFQALRIEVNQEIANIQCFLKAALKVLAPGGRVVCISFHSLEDREVKHFFRDNKNYLEIITKKPVIPSDEEIENNPSSRSAKLRVAEKK